MGVEGAEKNIISDSFNSSFLNKSKEYIIEYHHHMDADKSMLSTFIQKIESNGFNYNIKTNYKNLIFFKILLSIITGINSKPENKIEISG